MSRVHAGPRAHLQRQFKPQIRAASQGGNDPKPHHTLKHIMSWHADILFGAPPLPNESQKKSKQKSKQKERANHQPLVDRNSKLKIISKKKQKCLVGKLVDDAVRNQSHAPSIHLPMSPWTRLLGWQDGIPTSMRCAHNTQLAQELYARNA